MPGMRYRTLGSTGLRVSVIGLGTWQLGGEWAKDFTQCEVDRMFDRARACGINLIDTAECYGDHVSEALIGGAIQRDRDKWVVATKFGHRYHGFLNRTEPRTPADVLNQLEDSLRALRTDYIDLYQYHSWGDGDFARREVLDLLREQQKAGKILHLGNSISRSDRIEQTDKSREYGIEAIQVIYNRLDRTPEKQVFESCRRQNLGVLARVPLASGFLSGKYKPGASFAPDDVRATRKQEQIDQTLAEVARIRRAELPAGVYMAAWALAWCLQHPAVTCVIPGCKDEAQVLSNAAAADLDLVRDDHPQAAR
jgi:aryl-alcohol dehydrogenase-like predicted oxidoreductase